MQRFLVVGCGGSGGATLQFMIDQLRANLVSNGITTWPIEGWQFVHVDVPPAADGAKYGPTVEEQGGAYVRTSYSGATYPDVLNAVEAQLADHNSKDLLGSWTLAAKDVHTPVTSGAGQIRAVGRMLALARIRDIQAGLAAAWSRLQSPEAGYSIEAVADVFSPATKSQVNGDPIVLVVSSMAGGAGASMALDVCRVLGLIPGMTPDIGLYACTAEVFYELAPHLRAGVEGNALAMIGEVVAAQSGAASAEDNKLLQALGLNGVGQAAPFRRVFPIGSRVGGDGATFGDGSMEGVYRGLGRGLSALMLSGIATNDLVAYRLGNQSAPNVDRQTFGWGVPSDRLVWGSFGFASLAMGRDRYAEYAAQRIARRAIDHLVDGHRQPGDERDANTQVLDAASSRWEDFARRAGLPRDIGVNPMDWLGATLEPAADLGQSARRAVAEEFGHLLNPNPADAASSWVRSYQDRLPQVRERASNRATETAYRWAFNWYLEFTDRVVQATVEAVSLSGIPTARAVLDRLSAMCEQLSTDLRTVARNHTPPDIAVPQARVVLELAKVNGALAQFGAAVMQVSQHHDSLMLASMRGQIAGFMADVLGFAPGGLVSPLRKTLSDQLATLESARAERARTIGRAALRTSQYAAWPTGQEAEVPKRFAEAYNEVLMTSSESFERDFQHHIIQSISGPSGGTSPDLATQRVAISVISGRLVTLAAADETLIRLEESVRWRPPALGRTPDSPAAATVAQRHGRFVGHFGPDEIISGARAYVGRPHEAFNVFVSESLRQYVLAAEEPDHIRSEREHTLMQKFDQTLLMARPLVSIDPEALRRLHGAAEIRFEYAFSTVPFAGTTIELGLRESISQNRTLMSSVEGAFDAALSDLEAPSIDVFGFYPNYSPLTFRSLCFTIAETYSGLSRAERQGFWAGRRARGLPGSLPMSQEMREALVGGYYLGRQLDLVRWPAETTSGGIEVRSANGVWEPFRVPLLTNATAPEEVLPTLLEAYTLAAALWASQPADTLWPYRLLRSYYDDAVEPTPEGQPTFAGQLLSEYINHGTSLGVNVSAGEGVEPEVRRKGLVDHFQRVSTTINSIYAQPAAHSPVGTFAGMPVTGSHDGRRTMIAEIAPDIIRVTARLAQLAAQVQILDGAASQADSQKAGIY